MANRLTKRSRTTYNAGVPAQAGTPARCVTGPGYNVVYIDGKQLINKGVDTPPGYPTIVKYHLDATGRKVVDQILIPTMVPSDSVTTCYPAVPYSPGVEATSTTDQQAGWNSGARSLAAPVGDFELTFAFPPVPSGAVICGISGTNSTVGSFAAIEHGLYTSGVSIQFYESGAVKHTFSVSPAVLPSLSIQRIAGVVTAVVNGEAFRSGTRSTGSKSITAALYAAGDYVDSPVIGSVASGSSFAPLSLGNSPGSAPEITSHETTLLLGSASGKDSATAVVPVISLDGVVTVFDMAMSAVDHGIANDAGVQGADVSPGVNSSEDYYTAMRLVFDDPQVVGYDTDQLLEAAIVEGIIPDSLTDFTPSLFATISESLTLGTIINVMIAIDAKLVEILALPSNASANLILETVLRSGLAISDYSSQSRNEALQYATNVATGAVTRYSGFGFNSFCRVGTDLWATRPDGLYKIGGDTDNGDLLSYLIDFAADDQGTPRTKRLENIFFGIQTDGRTYARLTDDFGREQTYRLIQRDSSEARIETAKGASSRFWQLRLEGEEATYAEIDNIEWVAATGSRRTKR
ncbi:hypothetical protein ACI2KS_10345 [Pseudomonas sp. NPDC087358]|uniref:hypothetical protein n=1 Tax=Pseudomonas sp. NPDC087358 TaxID=3364439 RepID=UPI0038514481